MRVNCPKCGGPLSLLSLTKSLHYFYCKRCLVDLFEDELEKTFPEFKTPTRLQLEEKYGKIPDKM